MNISRYQNWMFRLDMRKHFFTKRVTKHWNRFPGEELGTPGLPVFKRHLDSALHKKDLMWWVLGQAGRLNDFCSSLSTEIIYFSRVWSSLCYQRSCVNSDAFIKLLNWPGVYVLNIFYLTYRKFPFNVKKLSNRDYLRALPL